MKIQTLSLCVLALSFVACDKKSKKNNPPKQDQDSGVYVPGDGYDNNYPGQNHPGQNDPGQKDPCRNADSNGNYDSGSHCDPNNKQVLTVVSTRSWRYTDLSRDNTISGPDKDGCLQSLKDHGSQLVMKTNNMGLRLTYDGQGTAARCLVHAEVSYPRGWAFAIRRASVSVKTSIRSNAEAKFEGSYQIVNEEALGMSQKFNRVGEQNTLVETKLNEGELAWSSCDGHATVALNTVLSMEKKGGYGNVDPRTLGDMSLGDNYGLDIVWAKCR